jgi:hypothetical protein
MVRRLEVGARLEFGCFATDNFLVNSFAARQDIYMWGKVGRAPASPERACEHVKDNITPRNKYTSHVHYQSCGRPARRAA